MQNLRTNRRKTIETWLDTGMGCCALNHLQMADVVQETFLRFDGEKYQLLAWCIMPNHVHVVINPFVSVGKIVQSWKSRLRIMAELGLGVPGEIFAQKEIDLLKQLAGKYKTQKRGLMQKLLSGEWRMKSEINKGNSK